MSFSRVNALGWALYEELTSAQMNQLDINMTRAIDGNAGGSYSPSAPINIGGAGLGNVTISGTTTSSGAVAFSSTVQFEASSSVAVIAGSSWVFNGDLELVGDVDVKGEFSIYNTATFEILSGANLYVRDGGHIHLDPGASGGGRLIVDGTDASTYGLISLQPYARLNSLANSVISISGEAHFYTSDSVFHAGCEVNGASAVSWTLTDHDVWKVMSLTNHVAENTNWVWNVSAWPPAVSGTWRWKNITCDSVRWIDFSEEVNAGVSSIRDLVVRLGGYNWTTDASSAATISVAIVDRDGVITYADTQNDSAGVTQASLNTTRETTITLNQSFTADGTSGSRLVVRIRNPLRGDGSTSEFYIDQIRALWRFSRLDA